MLTILSNLRLRPSWDCYSVRGTTIHSANPQDLARALRGCDLVVVNGIEATLKVCRLFTIAPWLRRPLISVDAVLRQPDRLKSRLSAAVTRHLLGRVDYFLHYFRDLDGYEKCFGISQERSAYVPFKPNLRYRVQVQPNAEGEYVLCIGHSMRDYETFFDAVESLPYPAAIPTPDLSELRRHHSRFVRPLNALPKNVRILPDNKSQESLVRILAGAKLVVLPILKPSICASGIGIYLNSMLLGKCVILSRGPGASDVLTDQAILFEPEDADDLTTAIRRAWEDNDLRIKTAAAGYDYALSLGGEPELYNRVLDKSVRWYIQQKSSHRLASAADIELDNKAADANMSSSRI